MRHEETRDNTTAIENQIIEADKRAREESAPYPPAYPFPVFGKGNTMTKTEAINYVRREMRMVLDDDYPDKMDSLVDELVDEGYGEAAAERLIFETQEWV